jgi:hypothetical protein
MCRPPTKAGVPAVALARRGEAKSKCCMNFATARL